MSKYGWESGSITLPAAEVAGVKQILREWTNAYHVEVRAEAVRMHKEVVKGTRSVRLYAERLRSPHGVGYEKATSRAGMVRNAARMVLEGILSQAQYRNVALHQPTLADVETVAPRATNRTTSFRIVTMYGFGEATVTIEGRTLHWSVPENNHAVEEAHEAPLGRLLFSHLARIQWTRGTGGHFVGNDEYTRDNYDSGGGENYLTSYYGPLGQQAKMDEYIDRGMTAAHAKQMVTAAGSARRY